MGKIKIVVFAGSARKESVNKKLARIATKLLFEAGADVQYIDLKDYLMPIYDGDMESQEGLPEKAKKFKEILKASHGYIIASPEYNSSIPPLLKNALDWISRAETENETPLSAFNGKVVALLSASPGGFGGMRGLVHLRSMLGNMGVIILPQQLCISNAFKAFNEKGELVSDSYYDRLKEVTSRLVEVTKSLNK